MVEIINLKLAIYFNGNFFAKLPETISKIRQDSQESLDSTREKDETTGPTKASEVSPQTGDTRLTFLAAIAEYLREVNGGNTSFGSRLERAHVPMAVGAW